MSIPLGDDWWIEETLKQCARMPPRKHQFEGGRVLYNKPFFMLADEMGSGKTKQVIDAAMLLFNKGLIDRIIVIAPQAVRLTWYDPDFGELSQHVWENTNLLVSEYHRKIRQWTRGDITAPNVLRVIVTNYDFIRRMERRAALMKYSTSKTLLVIDESSAIKGHKTAQTKAVAAIRKWAGRVWLLNGTPIANHPGDMFAQANIMHASILNCSSYTQFCTQYATMKPVLRAGGQAVTTPKGFVVKTVDEWTGIEKLQKRLAPYVLRRLKKDCLDLPEKLPPVVFDAVLLPATWNVYKEMRDELCVWLGHNEVATAPQIITKIMRLSQITSGFLGGVRDMSLNDGAEIDILNTDVDEPIVVGTRAIGREKLDSFFVWLDARLYEDPNLKAVVCGRFRPELDRAIRETRERYPHIAVEAIQGGQTEAERRAGLALHHPATAPPGPALVFMNPQSGGLGVNMTAATWIYRLSQDYSLFRRLQTDDRIHRIGQRRVVGYADLVATGPLGQRTIDHVILGAIRRKQELATLTTSAWRRELLAA